MPTLTEKGQVTIPKELRERFGLRSGDEVVFEETEEGIKLRKEEKENPFEKWKGEIETGKKTEEVMEELRGREDSS